jgi:hypothetical protein
MDMSGSMPRRAWLEVRDRSGELVGSFPSVINGGAIITELPDLRHVGRATITRCHESLSGDIGRDEPEEIDLGRGALSLHDQIG